MVSDDEIKSLQGEIRKKNEGLTMLKREKKRGDIISNLAKQLREIFYQFANGDEDYRDNENFRCLMRGLANRLESGVSFNDKDYALTQAIEMPLSQEVGDLTEEIASIKIYIENLKGFKDELSKDKNWKKLLKVVK